MKIFLIILICVFALALLILAAFGLSYKLHSSASTETLGKEETVYTAKENGCRIANIPYGEYLTETKAEKHRNAVGSDGRQGSQRQKYHAQRL